MKKYITFPALFLSLLIFLSACGKTATGSDTSSDTVNSEGFYTSDTDFVTESGYDADYDEDSAVTITTSDSSKSTAEGSTASIGFSSGGTSGSSANGVSLSNNTITITKAGTYLLSETISDGSVIIDAGSDDKVKLILNGASITSKTSAAIYVKNADKFVITTAKGTVNTLANGGSFTADGDNNIDGTVFSKDDITFNGEGTLTINSPAGHAVVGKDDVKFTGGTVTLNAASHGIDANDSVRIANAALTIDAGKDGIHVENSDDTEKGYFYMESGKLTIESEGDGASASAYAQIDGGTVKIISGGGSVNGSTATSSLWGGYKGGRTPGSTSSNSDSTSIKGLKAEAGVLISGGKITVDSADDAIHSNTTVTISGGDFSLASGDDGIHADTTLTVKGGTVKISKSYEGLEAQTVQIAGGTISVAASDDGVNAGGGMDQSGFGGIRGDSFGNSSSSAKIVISGGYLVVNAAGDGIDSNGDIQVTGGVTLVSGPTDNGNAAFDYDGSASVTGGTVLALGSTGMAQNFSSAKNQAACLIGFSSQSANKSFAVCDSSGKVIASFICPKTYACATITAPGLQDGSTYSIVAGGTVSGADSNGYAR